MSKGAFIKGMDGCNQKLQYTNSMEKNRQGEEGRSNDDEFSGVK